MQEHAALSPTSSLDPGRSLELCGADQGRAATFHFSDGSRLVVVVTDAVASARLEGHPTFDPATTGAADAARETVSAAKRSASKAKPKVAGGGR